MIVYIIGPYRANSVNGVLHNIWEARLRAEWCWTHGYIPICPHLNSAFIDGLIPDTSILASYRKIMIRCDAVMLVQGWEDSEGSKDEYDLAILHGMKIIPDPLGSSNEHV